MKLSADYSDRNKRIFIGLDIPSNISRFYYNMTLGLSMSYNCIRPIPPRNMHITLKFIGNTHISDIEKIKDSLDEELKDIHSFEYDIEDRVDAFPGLKNARIIYGVIGNGKEKIVNIYQKVIKAVSFLNIKEENKKFTPHITIARVRNRIDLTDLSAEIKAKVFRNVRCGRLTIYESILSGKGANYFINKEIYLNGNAGR